MRAAGAKAPAAVVRRRTAEAARLIIMVYCCNCVMSEEESLEEEGRTTRWRNSAKVAPGHDDVSTSLGKAQHPFAIEEIFVLSYPSEELGFIW